MTIDARKTDRMQLQRKFRAVADDLEDWLGSPVVRVAESTHNGVLSLTVETAEDEWFDLTLTKDGSRIVLCDLYEPCTLIDSDFVTVKDYLEPGKNS